VPTGKIDTYGTLIDDVRPLLVEIEDVSNDQLITDIAWIKGHKTV
jgi:hypothetical protein